MPGLTREVAHRRAQTPSGMLEAARSAVAGLPGSVGGAGGYVGMRGSVKANGAHGYHRPTTAPLPQRPGTSAPPTPGVATLTGGPGADGERPGSRVRTNWGVIIYPHTHTSL